MCGIVGYIGSKQVVPIVLDGLKRLEYRGYDSAGIAVYSEGEIRVERSKGKLSELENKLKNHELKGTIGLGHTRWATHGRPSDENAHPHASDRVVVVHNGIIENHLELRKKLLELGYRFKSDTDTETIPFLIESHLKNKGVTLVQAVRMALKEIEGTFALVIFSSAEPDKMIAAKNSSPLILGIGKGENFFASDIPALLQHTRDVIILDDGDMAIMTKNGYEITDFEGNPIDRAQKHVNWSRVAAEKEGYKHFMLKEIHEQPRALTDTLRSRVSEIEGEIRLDELNLDQLEVGKIEKITIVACGTSWHAALVGKYWLEDLAKIPVEVDLSSEFRYRNPIVKSQTLLIPISQSGETADTLAALEEGKKRGAHVLSICNVIDSSIARKSHHVMYTHAGPEIGVASTKAFTTQLASLLMFALFLGKKRKTISPEVFKKHLHSLITLPSKVEQTLKVDPVVSNLINPFLKARDLLYLGRGLSYPIAMEGALKMKEISYVHAEGYPGGEIKHGPIALIDEAMPVVCLDSGGPWYGKMASNIEEVVARGAKVIAVVTQGDDRLKKVATSIIEIPEVEDLVRPIVETVPLQFLAYYFAERLGKDVDQPRNLAKSVTVE